MARSAQRAAGVATVRKAAARRRVARLPRARSSTAKELLPVERPSHAAPGLWSTHYTGPPLLTGGAWGPEISMLSVLTCLVASAAFLAHARLVGSAFQQVVVEPHVR